MKNFKDFGIKTSPDDGFTGDKIKIDRIINREIIVHKFKIEDSKYKEKGSKKCLTLQISINDSKHIVFSGSKSLMDLIGQVPEDGFPFIATIIKENERLEFSN